MLPTPGHLDALQRQCPTCKALPGKPCMNSRYTEQVARWTHLSRSSTGKSKWDQHIGPTRTVVGVLRR